MMSEEQIQGLLQELGGELDHLSSLERPLTKEEEKHRKRLQFRKYVVDRIKEARAKGQKSDELFNTTYYSMLVPWGEKHPLLFFLWMRIIRARWWGISAYNYGDVWEKKEK
ncbi:MAG: hypothetical protein ISS58_06985 [Dehalococcoidales bacterium]|nr:hypothetical protein [Dehalococcoidales bacterium]